MVTRISSFNQISDQDLLREVARLAAREREATACLVASLAELDRRRLYLAEGYGSMFVYCTQCLHLSEASAYKRITVARAAERFPVILERLAEGAVSLATVSLLAAHMTGENHVALLDEARHRSKREVEEIVARLQPRPDVPSTVRKLPAPKSPPQAAALVHTTKASATPADTALGEPSPFRGSTTPSQPTPDTAGPPTLDASAIPGTYSVGPRFGQNSTANPSLGIVTPLAPGRYKLTVTISAETYEKLRTAQDLLRHRVPNGDLAVLLDRALTVLLRDAAKTKVAATAKPRTSAASSPRSRRIPAAVRRTVWERDEGQCAFVSARGHRCTERGQLEFHHVVPYAKGGEASVANIQLRCHHHNTHEAERDCGPWTATHVREDRPRYASDGVSVREASPGSGEDDGSGASRAEAMACEIATGPGASSTLPTAVEAFCSRGRARRRPFNVGGEAGYFSDSRGLAFDRPRAARIRSRPPHDPGKTSSLPPVGGTWSSTCG